MEEESEGEKSVMEFDTSKMPEGVEEFSGFADDTVLIKKPKSSKKSKSLENVNNKSKQSQTNKAIIEMYKKQQLEISE